MSKYISPTLTITSNANTATTDPGPLSIALNLSTSDKLTIAGHVESQTYVFANDASHVILFDGALSKYGNNTETAGSVGAWLYMKNVGAANNVFIGVGADDDVAKDIDGTNDGASYDDDTANAVRLFTLQPGEFCFFPYDYALRIIGDSSGAATLEYWLFDKA